MLLPACTGSSCADPGPAETIRDPLDPSAAAESLSERRGAYVDAALAAHHVEWPAAAREEAITAGREALTRLECNRCHTIDEVEPSSRPTHCVSCHQWLHGLEHESSTFTKLAGRYGQDVIERYQRNIYHYQEVPNLTRVADRLEPLWIAEYIQNPHDLRPMMAETMVRSQVSEADARVIARYFAAVAGTHDPYGEHTASAPEPAPLAPSEAQVERGRELFTQRGCNLCHTVGNVHTGKTRADLERMGAAAKLAPNLRFARERMRPELAVAWILDPQRFHPDTHMPQSNLTPEDAEAVRDFLFTVDPRLGPTPPRLTPALPPAVDRPVGWAEVKETTLGRICVHCHMNDHERDTGPGNQGGYGWPGVGLRMRTYEMLVAGQFVRGAAPPDGEARARESVLLPPAQAGTGRAEQADQADQADQVAADVGMPRLLEVMLARRVEEQRDRVEAFADYELPPDHGTELLGMPMGLPSIPDAELSILRAWIEQGCPGPTEVTGMPGIDDGYLVPDGPIGVNHGCQQRDPSATRPEWSTQPPPVWERPPAPAAAPDNTMAP